MVAVAALADALLADARASAALVVATTADALASLAFVVAVVAAVDAMPAELMLSSTGTGDGCGASG